MKLYHYSTWRGFTLRELGIIYPNNRYGFAAQVDAHNWPKLVFLTKNDYWEPSIQSVDPKGNWDKEETSPIMYANRGIKCWRFTVELKEPLFKLMYSHPYWLMMLEDAAKLGSDLSQWHWTEEPCEIKESAQWIHTKWVT